MVFGICFEITREKSGKKERTELNDMFIIFNTTLSPILHILKFI
jgi:hypothetical protein